MSIVCFDPGTEHTGFAVFESGKLVKSGVIESNEVGIKKLTDLANRMMYEIKYAAAEEVILEDYGYGSRFFNAEVAELVGIMKYLMSQDRREYTVMFIAPNTVKSIITGSGKAKKGEVMSVVNKLYATNGVKISHEADAIALGHSVTAYHSGRLSSDVHRKLKSRRCSNHD